MSRRRPSSAADADPAPTDAAAATDMPIVGVGCSAGGLQALTAFFGQMPLGTGMGFVVVQHLDPERPSELPQLLQRATSLHVVEATDGAVVQPDCVYVIPPQRDLSISKGVLALQAPVQPRGLRLSVDFFLRALAADRGASSIGVVLSGMGSDGVLGLRAIKEASGLTLAQEPATAESDSMPRSAITAGLVDIVAPAEQLPQCIVDTLHHVRFIPPQQRQHERGHANVLTEILALLRVRCGNDFAHYKVGTLQRRVERRMALHRLRSVRDYLRHVRANPHELDLLYKELLIGVTCFFRDPDVWETLRNDILPAMLQQHAAAHAFRAWVPACSSGEEAYTLAMVFRDAMAAAQHNNPGAPRHTLQIYATDLDADALVNARKSVYPKNIALDVGAERIARYFVDVDGSYRVAKEVRDMVIFAQHNVITDPPFTKLDVLTCRNLLIYFGPELQNKVLPLFHYALRPGGLLLLGNAETAGQWDTLFAPAVPRSHMYRRLPDATKGALMTLPGMPLTDAMAPPPGLHTPAESLGQLTDKLIQQTHAPAAVLVGADGDILYISGRTGKYLEPAAGKVNINIHAMARPGLAEALMGVIRQALRQAGPVLLRGIKVGTNGGTQHVDVTVQALETPEALRGRVLVVFKDVPAPPQPPDLPDLSHAPSGTTRPASARRDALEAAMKELHAARQALRVLREETQSSLEELKSANEELQSMNEELQSTNEELTTSKEEMQSMNEEMRTVNAELQSKVHDLTWERNDMANLLNSTEIATIFLDNDMALRRFTAFATKLFKLIPGDIGRPLSDLASNLDYPDLEQDALDVLRSLNFSEKEVGARDGRWYRARIMPYRTQDNVIDGVVGTFVDITQTKALEAKLRSLGGQG